MTRKPTIEQGPLEPSRRHIIKGAAGAAIAAGLPVGTTAEAAASLPAPALSGIDHIVVLMMENRSFDHMLGWLPGANGVQAGRTFQDLNGATQSSHKLTTYQNCTSADPDHSWKGGRTQLHGGKMDGFLLTQPAGDTFPVGYFGQDDVLFFKFAAQNFTVCDAYHCGILGPTYPNRIYMHSGQTDRISNTTTISTLPTIWDQAAAANVSAKYYYGDIALLGLWGAKYTAISHPFAQFQIDAAAGNLPSISYIDPRYLGEGAGTSNDDHPFADIRNGQVLMNEVYRTLFTAPTASKTLLIINYDEWGGFADHVAPRLGAVSAAEVAHGNVDVKSANGSGFAYLGFRTPMLLIGPKAYANTVSSTPFDPNAIINFICWRFGLAPLGVRAPTSGNIATALNFSSSPITMPPAVSELAAYNPVTGLSYGGACTANTTAELRDLEDTEHFATLLEMKQIMIKEGFEIV